MTDSRFDKLYILKIEEGEIDRLRHICEDYHISDNGAFENAASFHRIWGICENGLIYLSYGMAQRGFDFNSIDELEDFLDKFEIKN
jgi:hypothetical protein